MIAEVSERKEKVRKGFTGAGYREDISGTVILL